MIKGVVEYALDPKNLSPPPVLQMAWNVRNYKTLPNSGGIRDQFIGELERMTAVLRIYEAVSGYKRAKSKSDFIEHNPDDWEIYCRYVDVTNGRAKN